MSDPNNVDTQQLQVQLYAVDGSNLTSWIQENQNIWNAAGEDATWSQAEQELLQDAPQISPQLYTPGSDIAVGFRQNQIIAARDGNDALLGLNPVADNAGQLQIDIFLGDFEFPQLAAQAPTPRAWHNTFILGDWKQPYYTKAGDKDFALLADFNPSRDTIQLYGTPQDYQLVASNSGTEIWWHQGNVSDLIALVPSVSNLSLEGDYFSYEGYTPPEGPVVGQVQQFGTGDLTISNKVATDPSGNVYLAGGTSGALGGPNAGSRDAFVAKYDSNGNQEWIRQFGSSEFDTTYGLNTDSQGNVYLTGYTEGNLGGTKQTSYADTWLAKYDSNGNQVWIQNFGLNDTSSIHYINVSGNGIAVDQNANLYLTGVVVATDQSSASLLTDNSFVSKYDSNGNRQWYTQFGAPYTVESYGDAVDSNGNVYATGWTTGDLGGKNAGLYDAWVAKLDTNGNQQWIKQFGSNDYDWSWAIDVDSQGNSYSTGWTLGNLGGVKTGSYDAWLAKYDTNGNQQWIKQFGNSGDTEAFNVKADSNGNIFVAGYTNGNLGGTNAGSFDAWVAKYDSNGNQQWIKQFGTSKLDEAYGVTVDNAGHVYVTGVTEGSLGGTNSGSVDGWIAKLDAGSGNLENFTGTAAPANGSDGRPFSNRDMLTSTNSSDSIASLPGQNIITLAGGSDTITYQTYKGGNDSITNFSAADDRIDLSKIFTGPNYTSTNPFNDYVKLVQMGSTTQVQINPAGDYHNIFTTLVTLDNVNATDLTANNFVV